MARRFVSVARDILLVMFVTPMLLSVAGLGVGLVFIVVPSTGSLWPVVNEVAFVALITSTTSFITTRIGKTLPVALVSAIAPFGFLLSLEIGRGVGGRDTLPLEIACLVFASGVAGAYVGYRMSAGAHPSSKQVYRVR